jgi:hypothetical protein
MTEKQPYQVIRQYPGFELRKYPLHVLVQVTVKGDFMSAGNMGFGPLLRYISGYNRDNQKISMTAPVVQSSENEQTHTVSFVLPEDLKPSDVPVPSDARVSAVTVEPQSVAAITFSGGWNEVKFQERAEDLLAAVSASGLQTVGNVYFARYDPPYKPAFLRRNEALVQIKSNDPPANN